MIARITSNIIKNTQPKTKAHCTSVQGRSLVGLSVPTDPRVPDLALGPARALNFFSEKNCRPRPAPLNLWRTRNPRAVRGPTRPGGPVSADTLYPPPFRPARPVEVLILMGAPGAGKSTFAHNYLIDANERGDELVSVCSADHYFETAEGYRWDASSISEAHGQCLRQFTSDLTHLVYTRGSLLRGTLIVDNTNTTLHEIAPYMALALAYGATVRPLVFYAPDHARYRNVHNVPDRTVDAALDRLNKTLRNWPRHWPRPAYVAP